MSRTAGMTSGGCGPARFCAASILKKLEYPGSSFLASSRELSRGAMCSSTELERPSVLDQLVLMTGLRDGMPVMGSTTLLIIFCDRYLLDLFGPALFFPRRYQLMLNRYHV